MTAPQCWPNHLGLVRVALWRAQVSDCRGKLCMFVCEPTAKSRGRVGRCREYELRCARTLVFAPSCRRTGCRDARGALSECFLRRSRNSEKTQLFRSTDLRSAETVRT